MLRQTITSQRLHALLILLAILLSSFGNAGAQTAGLTLQAQPAFDGYFKYGEWLPVWVTLENQGSDLDGEISILVAGSGGTMIFVAPAEMPAGARKRLPVYVLPNNFSRSLQVQYTSNGETLASQLVTIQPQLNSSFFVGIAAPERGALNQLNGLSLPGQPRKVYLIDLDMEQIPPRHEGLRSFDVIILNGLDTSSLSPEQSAALDNWVHQGGRLVLGGGPLALETAAGFQNLALPLTPETTLETSDLEALAAYPGGDQPALAQGTTVISQGALASDANLLAGSRQQPLLVEAARGKGAVDVASLDLSTTPFEGWSGVLPFWQKLLSPNASYPAWLSPDVSSRQQMASQMGYALQNLPVLDLPSVKGLALLLGFYILVIGPLNYLVLRAKNRLHWAWVTIPLITLIFSISAFSLGYALHGSDVFVNRAALIETNPTGKATYTSYIGVFSPARSGFEIEVPGGGLLSPLSPYYNPWDSFGTDAGLTSGRSVRLMQTDPAYVQGLTVDQWSMQSFMMEGLEMDFGGETGGVTSDLRIEGSLLQGSVTNRSQYLLKDVTVIFGRRFQRLGDLPAGESAQLSLDLSGIGEPTFGSPVSYMIYEAELNPISSTGPPPRTAEVKRTILEALLQWGSPLSAAKGSTTGKTPAFLQAPVFLGWLDEAPPEVQIKGEKPAQQSTALVYSLLSYELPDSQKISLPTGIIPGSLVQLPMDGGTCGEIGATAVYIFRGEADFEFYLPAQFSDMLVEQLRLGIWNDSGVLNPPQTALYDWETQVWLTQEGLVNGENLIPADASLVSENGVVRVRLTGDGSVQSCFYLALGVDGQRR